MGFSFGFGDTFVVSNGGLFINIGGTNPPSAATVINGTIVPPVIPNPAIGGDLGEGGSSGSLSVSSSAIDFRDITESNRRPSLDSTTLDSTSVPSGVSGGDNPREAQILEMSISENEVMQISIEPVMEDVIGNDEAGNPTLIGQTVVGERFISQGSPTSSGQLPPNFLSNLLSRIFSGIGRS